MSSVRPTAELKIDFTISISQIRENYIALYSSSHLAGRLCIYLSILFPLLVIYYKTVKHLKFNFNFLYVKYFWLQEKDKYYWDKKHFKLDLTFFLPHLVNLKTQQTSKKSLLTKRYKNVIKIRLMKMDLYFINYWIFD